MSILSTNLQTNFKNLNNQYIYQQFSKNSITDEL